MRGRLGVRDALVRTRTRYITVVRARLRQDGWRVGTGSAEGFSRRVLVLPLPGRLLSEVAPLLAVMRHVNEVHSIETDGGYFSACVSYVNSNSVRRVRAINGSGGAV